jgi:hypothetical protein
MSGDLLLLAAAETLCALSKPNHDDACIPANRIFPVYLSRGTHILAELASHQNCCKITQHETLLPRHAIDLDDWYDEHSLIRIRSHPNAVTIRMETAPRPAYGHNVRGMLVILHVFVCGSVPRDDPQLAE